MKKARLFLRAAFFMQTNVQMPEVLELSYMPVSGRL